MSRLTSDAFCRKTGLSPCNSYSAGVQMVLETLPLFPFSFTIPAMKSVCIVYHSGTGGTRTIAELVATLLARSFAVRIVEAGRPGAVAGAENADALVIGFPTFYLKPTPTILEFTAALPRFASPKPAFVFTTAALYAENSIRRFAPALAEKNVFVFGAAEIGSPSSDGVFTSPAFLTPALRRFGRTAASKIHRIADDVGRALGGSAPVPLPLRPKWYTPVTQLLQALVFNSFDRFRTRFSVDPDRCSLCGRCAAACFRCAWTGGRAPYTHDPAACELCLRCVHHCPRRAIGWGRKMIDRERLTPAFHRELKRGLLEELGVEN
jgi:ferredoxin/flavodoxin